MTAVSGIKVPNGADEIARLIHEWLTEPLEVDRVRDIIEIGLRLSDNGRFDGEVLKHFVRAMLSLNVAKQSVATFEALAAKIEARN